MMSGLLECYNLIRLVTSVLMGDGSDHGAVRLCELFLLGRGEEYESWKRRYEIILLCCETRAPRK